ncbi:hypothetical protein [Bacteroides heparinolyticus]|uniref:hypothetical protein n=1 Tax=Prevotella heparinolytica TaxID=28113 RepID=UPI0035A0F161
MIHLIQKNFFLALIAGVLMLTSCDKNETPVPEPGSEKELVFKFSSSNLKEFQKITGENITNLAKEETKNYFGNRIAFATPDEVKISNDSIFIRKPHGIEEKFAAKWQKDELFIFREPSGNWEQCGKLSEKKRFLLNIGLFTKLSRNERRTLYVSGQDYSLTGHDKIQKTPNDIIVWLKLEVTLEKK